MAGRAVALNPAIITNAIETLAVLRTSHAIIFLIVLFERLFRCWLFSNVSGGGVYWPGQTKTTGVTTVLTKL